jgi:hypothetical protein
MKTGSLCFIKTEQYAGKGSGNTVPFLIRQRFISNFFLFPGLSLIVARPLSLLVRTKKIYETKMIRAALGNHENIFREFVRSWIRLLSIKRRMERFNGTIRIY